MKIIKRGIVTKTVYRGTCGKCKSVLETENRGELDSGYDPRENYSWLNGKCPVCGCMTPFKEEEVIDPDKNDAPTKYKYSLTP